MYSVMVIAESGKVPKGLTDHIKDTDQYNLIGSFPNCVVALNALATKSPQIVMIYTHMAFWSTERFIQTVVQKGIAAQFVLIRDEPDDPFYISDYSNRISASVTCEDLSKDAVLRALEQAKEDWNAYNNPSWIKDGKGPNAEELSQYLTKLANGDFVIEQPDYLFRQKEQKVWLLWGIPAEKEVYIDRGMMAELLKPINYYLMHNVGGVSTILRDNVLCCLVECSIGHEILPQFAHPMQQTVENINGLLKKNGAPNFQFFIADEPILISDFGLACRQMESLQKYTFFSNQRILMWPTWLENRAKRSSEQMGRQYISSLSETVYCNNSALMHEVFRQLEELIRQSMSFSFYTFIWNSMIILYHEIAKDNESPEDDWIPRVGQNRHDSLSSAMAEFEQVFSKLALQIDQRQSLINPIIQSAKSYLKEHFSEKITLETVAREAHASVSHVSRLFKSEVGMTFTEYLNSLRIERSKQLLMTKMPVQQVAEQAGFDSPKYFSKVFRKISGQSPAQYRKSCGRHTEENQE